jgi:hypothetical protein
MEALAKSNIKNADLITEVLNLIESDFFKALDIVADIVELRARMKIVERLRRQGHTGGVDKMISRYEIRDIISFRKLVLDDVKDLPEKRPIEHCSCFCFLNRTEQKTRNQSETCSSESEQPS